MTAHDRTAAPGPSTWDHSTRKEFLDYYAESSLGAQRIHGFAAARNLVLRFVDSSRGPLSVADIGCGAGTQSMMWAAMGHHVHGVDISAELLDLARQRARAAGHTIDFRLGSGTRTPWPADTMDVCLVLELLEHVPDWQACLDECMRLLRPGGVLLLATTNVLCPSQQEFSLPLYSWYPGPLKRYFEQLARTTRPDLAGHATYPAVNWFSFYGLRAALRRRGFHALDRFDVMDLRGRRWPIVHAVRLIRAVPLLRLMAHVGTPYTVVLGIKQGHRQ